MTDKIIHELEKRLSELREIEKKYNCGFPIGNNSLEPKFFLINIEIIANFFKWILAKQIRLDILSHKVKGRLFQIFSKSEFQTKSISKAEHDLVIECIYLSENTK